METRRQEANQSGLVLGECSLEGVLENKSSSSSVGVVGVVVVIIVVVVVVVGGCDVVVVVVVWSAGSKTNPRRQKIRKRPRHTHHTPQGNHQWRTPWWRRSQRDQSLEVFRGSDTSDSASCRK